MLALLDRESVVDLALEMVEDRDVEIEAEEESLGLERGECVDLLWIVELCFGFDSIVVLAMEVDFALDEDLKLNVLVAEVDFTVKRTVNSICWYL